jgi:hypothetical protein
MLNLFMFPLGYYGEKSKFVQAFVLVHMISDTLPPFFDFIGSALKTPVV